MRSRRQEQRRGGEVSSPSPSPMNRTRICLDGVDGTEALPSYIAGIDSILAWCRANGTCKDVSRLFGPDSVVFTTPPRGTFYVDLESKGRCLELVVNGRDLYTRGWRGPNGSFEIKPKTQPTQPMNYMIGDDVRIVAQRPNYGQLIPEGEVGFTKMGIHEFRRAFDKVFDYRGGSPGKIAESIGIIAVNISEATRLQGAFDTVCSSFVDPNVSRLHDGKFDTLWVNRYGHYCEQGMIQIDQRMSGLVPEAIKIRDIKVESAEEILKEIRVFHYDAYDQGIFAHGPNPKPKAFREEPGKAYPFQGLERGKGSPGRWGNSKWAGKGVAGKKDRPPHRKYMTSALHVSSSPPELDKCQDCMEQSNRACDLQTAARRYQSGASALNSMSAQISEWLAHFPALRKLCNVSYETRKHERSALPFHISAETTVPQQDSFQRLTFAKLCKAKIQCKAPLLSWLPTTGQKVRKTQDMETAQRLRTGFRKPTPHCVVTKSTLSPKAPIQWAGTLISRVMRVLRR